MSRIRQLLFSGLCAAFLIALSGCGKTEENVIPPNDDPAVIPTDSSAVEPIPETEAPEQSASPDDDSTEPEMTADTETDAPADEGLVFKNYEELQELIAEQQGKVVVVDYWSTWCAPCVREFPQLVELQERFGKDVVCISASCNYDGLPDSPPESYREEVQAFLDEQKAGDLVNVVMTVEAEALFEQLNLASIPAVYVYNREGELAQRFDNEDPDKLKESGEFTYEKDIIPLVEELVANEPAAEEQTSE